MQIKFFEINGRCNNCHLPVSFAPYLTVQSEREREREREREKSRACAVAQTCVSPIHALFRQVRT